MALLLAGCIMTSHAAQGLERVDGSPIRMGIKQCRADETLFMAIRTTRFEGGIRVDYQLVKTGGARWANMDAELLRKFRIKAGAPFCMPLDRGDAADSPVDYD